MKALFKNCAALRSEGWDFDCSGYISSNVSFSQLPYCSREVLTFLRSLTLLVFLQVFEYEIADLMINKWSSQKKVKNFNQKHLDFFFPFQGINVHSFKCYLSMC